MQKACFIDRDGVLIEDKHYLQHIDDVKLTPKAAEAIQQFHKLGFLSIIVSNQSGVARGMFPESSVVTIHNYIQQLLAKHGDDATIDHYYYCPHHPKGDVPKYSFSCDCRKPELGMLLKGQKEYDIDFSKSIMIGDKLSDMMCGINGGMKRAFLVKTGYGETTLTKKEFSSIASKVTVVDNLFGVVEELKKGN